MNRKDPSDQGSFLVRCIVFALGFLVSCWPYLIWHGEDRYGRMTWDASSWTACLIWWLAASLIVFVTVVLVKANSPCARYAEQQEKEEKELAALKARYQELQREQLLSLFSGRCVMTRF